MTSVQTDVDLTTTIAGLRLPNPLMTASGCAAAGRELHQFFDVAELGAVVTKSVMLQPRSGRPAPRMAETPSGMLNSIGLQGPAAFVEAADAALYLAKKAGRNTVRLAATDSALGCAELAQPGKTQVKT